MSDPQETAGQPERATPAETFLESLPAREAFPINRTETLKMLEKFNAWLIRTPVSNQTMCSADIGNVTTFTAAQPLGGETELPTSLRKVEAHLRNYFLLSNATAKRDEIDTALSILSEIIRTERQVMPNETGVESKRCGESNPNSAVTGAAHPTEHAGKVGEPPSTQCPKCGKPKFGAWSTICSADIGKLDLYCACPDSGTVTTANVMQPATQVGEPERERFEAPKEAVCGNDQITADFATAIAAVDGENLSDPSESVREAVVLFRDCVNCRKGEKLDVVQWLQFADIFAAWQAARSAQPSPDLKLEVVYAHGILDFAFADHAKDSTCANCRDHTVGYRMARLLDVLDEKIGAAQPSEPPSTKEGK